MDGNVFSNSLSALGQWLLNNPQGNGNPTAAAASGGLPTKITTQYHYDGQPGAGQDQVSVPTSSFSTAAGGEVTPLPKEAPLADSAQAGKPQQGGPGGAGGAGAAAQSPTGAASQSALSGISSALTNIGKNISSVNTTPGIVEGGQTPGINQQAAPLLAKRPQATFTGYGG
jgi:hypothetical protein